MTPAPEFPVVELGAAVEVRPMRDVNSDVSGIEVDLGGLTAYDKRVGVEGSLIEAARSGVEPLVHAIFSVPSEYTDAGRLIELPKPSVPMPREKVIPKEREATKWEKYAKEKGISKKRRSRLVFHEPTGEYLPRYGKNSAKSLQRDVILPHKEGDGGENPFLKKRREQKERVKFEQKKQRGNLGRAAKKNGTHNHNMKDNPLTSMDAQPRGPSGKRNIPLKNLKAGISVLQKSTASAGKFDKRVKNEPKVITKGKRRKFHPVADKKGMVNERERAQKVLNRVLLGQR